ncbi:MAG: TIGR04053 family radical SAM/SPASM domain-containing protein [Caldilineaceae bacterium]|nr:TIGR04053 family radical SAM/SPASM domain-containing protein [Caldilineaceae bacterium]
MAHDEVLARLAALEQSDGRRWVFARAPQLIYWEITRACDLACIHCRAEAITRRSRLEFSTDEGKALLRQIVEFGGPRLPQVVITGGDPLQRPDLFELIAYGRAQGLSMSVTPAGTARLTPEVVDEFQAAGIASLALSLDGATAQSHDAFRGVDGSYAWTLDGARAATARGIPLQINTMVTAGSADELPAIYEVVRELGITRWALFFLISTGRGQGLAEVTPAKSERVLNWIWQRTVDPATPFAIKTTEAHHYRRIGFTKLARRATPEAISASPMGRGFGIRDGNGIVFVSHVGEVYPSGFLPLAAGNIRRGDSLVEVYRHHPLFVGLRDADQLEGKCGVCAFRRICGGSRARAYAATGNPLASDPLCPYVPEGYESSPQSREGRREERR